MTRFLSPLLFNFKRISLDEHNYIVPSIYSNRETKDSIVLLLNRELHSVEAGVLYIRKRAGKIASNLIECPKFFIKLMKILDRDGNSSGWRGRKPFPINTRKLGHTWYVARIWFNFLRWMSILILNTVNLPNINSLPNHINRYKMSWNETGISFHYYLLYVFI